MSPERADQMLREYKMYVGRCKYLSELLPTLKAEADAMRNSLAAQLSGVGAQNLDGMPHGTNVGNPTERAGIILADGSVTSDDLQELERQIADYERELGEKSAVIRFVDAWLGGLNENEQWLVRRRIIDRANWRRIIGEYESVCGKKYTYTGVKIVLDGAMDKIYQMAM